MGRGGLGCLERKVRELQKMLAEAFDEYRDLGLYTRIYHTLDQMMEDFRGLGTVSAFESNPYEHSNVHIKWTSKRILYRRLTVMRESINVTGKSYEKVLSYGIKRMTGNRDGVMKKWQALKEVSHILYVMGL